jgi:ribonuclease HII
MPDFSIENAHRKRTAGAIAGIDEAGRGPWAGPVLAAAVVLDPDTMPAWLAEGLDDSKALSRGRRAELFDALTGEAEIGIGQASVAEIDSLNILAATFMAMRRALVWLTPTPTLALVDGNRAPPLPCPVETVVGGDGRSLSIAAASIVAKVTRDRIMAGLAEKHPDYGWERNAGYGTRQHRDALARHGVTRHHRRSFAPIRKLLNQKSY